MNHPYLLKKIVLIFFVILSFSVSALAQSTVKGKVTDAKTGEPLTGATVHLEGAAKHSTSVKLDGSYIFKNVPVGSYQLTVRFIGYKTSKAYNVETVSGKTTVLNLTLVDNATGLNEVNIVEQAGKESDRSVRSLEKNAAMVENILSQNTIQLLPDVTVGNALQRVSGVTIQRASNGEGRYAIIRGMDQRYNNTLVNGIKIPSPDDKFRFVPMDVFPSEMLERLEVIKALTPSMEGDAIGGTMNLVMKSAPDHFIISANASAGFSSLFSKGRLFTSFKGSPNTQSPAMVHGNNYAATFADFNNKALTSDQSLNNPLSSTAGLTIGDRFLQKKLGVIISASYQNVYRGSNSNQLTPNAQPTANATAANIPQFSDAYTRSYSTQTQRLGIHNKIDYSFNKSNKLSLYNLYIHTNEYQARQTADTLGLGLNSTLYNKQVTISNRSTLTQQNIYNSTLQGNHQLADKIKFNWSAVYSYANRHQPDRTDFAYDANQTLNNAGAIVSELDNNTKLSHHWENNKDQDITGYANFIFDPQILSHDVEISVGGLLRHKNRDADYITYSLIGGNKSTVYSNNFSSLPFVFNLASDGVGSNNPDLQDNYTVKEDDNAEYVQFKFNPIVKLQVLGGVRVENTLQKYETQSPITVSQRAGTTAYTDVLPSLHLKYEISGSQSIRASYFASLSRPGYGEIVPYKVSGEYYDEEGNPYLHHITADNFDLRYDLFPGGADQLLLGTFLKKIHNPIEYFVVRDGGPSNQVIKPQNDDGDATNYGFEAQATKFFGVIGFSVNYTYTHSSITTDKLLYFSDPVKGLQQTYVSQTRPLQGQADNVGNASILFKSGQLGLDMQLAFVYTGERLAQVSPYYNLDFYQHAYNQLDFSFEKMIGKKLSFFGKVNNITNTASKLYLKYPNAKLSTQLLEFIGKQDIVAQTLVQSDYYKTLFLGGLRYKF